MVKRKLKMKEKKVMKTQIERVKIDLERVNYLMAKAQVDVDNFDLLKVMHKENYDRTLQDIKYKPEMLQRQFDELQGAKKMMEDQLKNGVEVKKKEAK